MMQRLKGSIAMSTIKRVSFIATAIIAIAVMLFGGAGVAFAEGTTINLVALSNNLPEAVPLGPPVEKQVIAKATKSTVMPNRYEGIISIVTRTCDTAKNWQSVAADNRIDPPEYIVLYQVPVKVDCASTTTPVAVTTSSGATQKTVTTVTTTTTSHAAWTNPLPGTCRPPSGGGQFGAPRDGGARSHQGIDLGGIENKKIGTPILAAASGTVFVSGWVSGNAGYGVEIRHANGVVTKYFHMTRPAVGNGTQVKAGQTIGYMGATGDATGPHLHFEVWVNGALKNAAKWLDSQGVPMSC